MELYVGAGVYKCPHYVAWGLFGVCQHNLGGVVEVDVEVCALESEL